MDSDASWVAGVRDRLVEWYLEAGRALPWRVDRDAYRILVSELMLIQTTVAAVIPYFERFIRQFPDARALAAADEAVVRKAWEGLGYYRRARQLHAAARTITNAHGGTIPNEVAAVRALPGVGRYIAGAVLSFAFDRPEPIVEANSQRVLARLLAVRENLKTSPAQARIWQAAERLVPHVGAGSFNQAIIELGALVCTPKEPACLVCPLVTLCEARRLGLQDRLPVVTPKPPPAAVTEAGMIVMRGGRVLIVQRGTGGLWEQFWEFPTIHLEGVDPAGRSLGDCLDLAAAVHRFTGMTVRRGASAQDDCLQRHESQGEADRAPGRSALGDVEARTRLGRRPLGRAFETGRVHFQLSRPQVDRLAEFRLARTDETVIVAAIHRRHSRRSSPSRPARQSMSSLFVARDRLERRRAG